MEGAKSAHFCSMCGPHFRSMKITKTLENMLHKTESMRMQLLNKDCVIRLRSFSTAEQKFILNHDEWSRLG